MVPIVDHDQYDVDERQVATVVVADFDVVYIAKYPMLLLNRRRLVEMYPSNS
jgi:hypothetical protein